MCRIKTGIILKDKVYMPFDENSHAQMLEDLKIKDNKLIPDFVKFEIVPKDGNLFNHDLNNWEFSEDQNHFPDWYDKEKVMGEVKEKLQEWFKARFVMSGETVDEIKNGVWYCEGYIGCVFGGIVKFVTGGMIRVVKGGIIDSVFSGIIGTVAGGVVNYFNGGIIVSVYDGIINNINGGCIKCVFGGIIGDVNGGIIDSVKNGIIGNVNDINFIKEQLGGVIMCSNKMYVANDSAYVIEKRN